MIPLLLALAAPSGWLDSPLINGRNCRVSPPMSAAAPNWRARPRRLGELPPAMGVLTVLRAVEGCPVIQVMNRSTDPPGTITFRYDGDGALMRLSPREPGPD
jgi:hypothetical protein